MPVQPHRKPFLSSPPSASGERAIVQEPPQVGWLYSDRRTGELHQVIQVSELHVGLVGCLRGTNMLLEYFPRYYEAASGPYLSPNHRAYIGLNRKPS